MWCAMKRQRSELAAELTVRALVRSVCAHGGFLLVPYFMGNVWDI